MKSALERKSCCMKALLQASDRAGSTSAPAGILLRQAPHQLGGRMPWMAGGKPLFTLQHVPQQHNIQCHAAHQLERAAPARICAALCAASSVAGLLS